VHLTPTSLVFILGKIAFAHQSLSVGSSAMLFSSIYHGQRQDPSEKGMQTLSNVKRGATLFLISSRTIFGNSKQRIITKIEFAGFAAMFDDDTIFSTDY
jgi:hypothetical protein